MARQVVARRRDAKKWWAPSTNAAHLGARPRRVRTLAGVARARSESESRRDPETRQRVKGGGEPRGSLRSATQNDVALRAAQAVEARIGRQLRRGRGFRARSVVPARLCSKVAESEFDRPLPVRHAERRIVRVASGGQPGLVARRARGAAASESRRRVGGRHPGSFPAVPFTGCGEVDLDPSVPTQADLRWRKRGPGGDGMSEAKS